MAVILDILGGSLDNTFLIENQTFSHLFLLNSSNNAKRKEVKGNMIQGYLCGF